MKHYSFNYSPIQPLLIRAVIQHKTHPFINAVTASIMLAILIFGSTYAPATAQSPVLGDAIRGDVKDAANIIESTGQKSDKTIQAAALQETSTPLVVNLSTRQEALDFYNANYANRDGTAMGWNGNQSSCQAGNVSGAFRTQYIQRINYFRAMAGVPGGVVLNNEYNVKAQQAALMMSANNTLSHGPDSSWTCYTEAGKDAAGSSNLFLGMAGINSVDGYIMDPGAGNGAVGHRRWLLHPATQKMGIGSVADKGKFREANAIWVFDSSIWSPRPATRDEFVAWPPSGFVPYEVTFARWSFAYPDADFSAASVSMTSNGGAVAVDIEPISNGFGENTLVWKAMGLADNAKWPKPVADTPYTVTIRNVRINGQARNFTYTVTIFDPAVEVATPAIEVNFDAAAPGSFLTVNGDGFTANKRVPIELNGTRVKNVKADANGGFTLILNTRGAAEGAYLINAPVMRERPETWSGYNLDRALPVRKKQNLPGVQTASVRNIEPLQQLFMPLVLQ